MSLFYKPQDGWAGDFIPFYKDGRFQLFYLLDWRNSEQYGEGTPWYLISTDDFVQFEEHGEVIPRGGEHEQDLYIFTGCAIEAKGQYHIFYTGHNPHFMPEGKPAQAVMHAVSDDLLHWRKAEEDTFFAPAELYEPHDWRDPFVFWNEEAEEYWMLLAARLKDGPSRRRGCTALCASKDLKHWEVRDPFWSPHLYYTHECPDLFRMGDWWYLVFSTFSDKWVTHYRMSKSLQGPWLAPDDDAFDGRAYYAAKTFSDGNRRYVFGWNPTKSDDRDDGQWQWGGNLVVHEVIQRLDGTLRVSIPEQIDHVFKRDLPVPFKPGIGKWDIDGDRLQSAAADSFSCAISGELPSCCKLAATITFSENTRSCGMMLRFDDDLENGYYIRLEPDRNRFVFDCWPRRGDVPYLVDLERPITLVPETPYELKVIMEDSICEIYLNDQVAMSARMYDHKQGKWGVFVTDGEARFSHITLSGRE
ncbi:glycoside hydrolase family 32 protein [Paenibacillus montanisoli]|uniref:beta-fructofuranosidase n=1 Tax=Paenibacillus montanisoli TaxID=2081970 RepID=A0A328U6M9_9BACL|nr:glycoside hydrolase family 32 protein [Paenibacillus montanisoli]RAP77732.1 glycoside hydrolase [Paenibacillus montanisoli]